MSQCQRPLFALLYLNQSITRCPLFSSFTTSLIQKTFNGQYGLKWSISPSESRTKPLAASTPTWSITPKLSEYSTCGVADSAWSSFDFLVGAAMVVIQQNTHKVLVLYESKKKYWFFPRGRKDMGESIEQAALREAYEESGYHVQFLPLIHWTRQPAPPENLAAYNRPSVEPIFITIKSWQPRRNDHGGEYLTTWYAGQIPEDAIQDVGTGMADEQDYESFLLPIEEAMKKVLGQERHVLAFVWNMYIATNDWLESLGQAQAETQEIFPEPRVPESHSVKESTPRTNPDVVD